MKAFFRVALALAMIGMTGIKAAAQETRAARRHPVNSAESAFANLFSLPPKDTAYFFRVNLPGDNFMTMRFDKISSWETASLKDIVGVANLSWQQLRDSLSGAATSRRIALSIPENNYPVLTAFREYGTDERIMMLGSNGPQPIRIAYDTISVLRRFRNTSKDTSIHPRVLYTFLLKDLGQIEQLADDSALIGDISRSFDSIIANRRQRWKSPDQYTHGIGYDYNTTTGPNVRKLQRNYEMAWYKYFDYSGELGTSFAVSTIGSYSSLRLAYNFTNTRPASYGYLALSFSGLIFAREEAGQLEGKGVGFLNFEIGSVIGGSISGLPVYRTGVGFGYRVSSENAHPYNFRYRLFFIYGVTKSITIMPDYYIIPIQERNNRDEGLGVGGLTLSVRLF